MVKLHIVVRGLLVLLVVAVLATAAQAQYTGGPVGPGQVPGSSAGGMATSGSNATAAALQALATTAGTASLTLGGATTISNGVNPQSFRVYNSWTDASNGEWGTISWNDLANVLSIGTRMNGTGVARNIQIIQGGARVLGQPNGGADVTSWASGNGALAAQSANTLYNTASGVNALHNNTTGNNNTASGSNALHNNTTGNYNTASGLSALRFNTTGNNNIAIGVNALHNNTTGNYNTASGYGALFSNTTDNYNTASGYGALFSNTTGAGSTAAGYNALYDNGAAQTAGAFVSGISYTILTIGTTDFTLIGAASNTVGVVFTATGVGSGTGTATPNTNNNTAIGYNTGLGITYGSNNTILGANVTGLAAGLSGAVILAGGLGNIRADYGETNAANWTFAAPVIVPSYIVSALPAGVLGAIAYVTDQLTACPTLDGTFTGGGSVKCFATYNGTAWVHN